MFKKCLKEMKILAVETTENSDKDVSLFHLGQKYPYSNVEIESLSVFRKKPFVYPEYFQAYIIYENEFNLEKTREYLKTTYDLEIEE